MKKQRKQYAPEEKVAILRRQLLEKEPISKLCDEVGLQPTVFYRWQKEFFENGAAAFEQKRPTNHSADQERIAYLQKKIQTKDEVLAELMAEHVALRKDIGELWPGAGFRTIRGIRSWISSGAGRRRPRSAPGGSLGGSTSPLASSTTGGNATGR
jgi:transposase